MVSFRTTAVDRLRDWLKTDLAGFRASLVRANRKFPELKAYEFTTPGFKRRVHLRLEAQDRAVLFVDANQTCHLRGSRVGLAESTLADQPATRFELDGSSASRPSDLSAQGEPNLFLEALEALQAPGHVCFKAWDQPWPATAPFKADLALTYACNNSCGHCYNEAGRRSMASLEPEKWRQVLDRLWAIGTPHVIFTGGEPTLHPHLAELIEHASGLGQVAGLNTNGRRLAEPGFASRLARAGLDHVQITLESHRPEIHNQMTGADSYRETLAGLRESIRAGLHVITNTTLTRSNVDHVWDLIGFLHDQGLETIAMNGMIHSGSGTGFERALSEDELAPVLAVVKGRAEGLNMQFLWYSPTEYCRCSPLELEVGAKTCNAAEYSVCVEPNGDVLPCQSMYRPAGNILNLPWSKIWDSPGFRLIRERRTRPVEAGLPEKCRDCPDLEICAGGCPLTRRAGWA